MSSVTFSTSVGGDGSTVTDDDNATTGLGNGGALIRLVPMMQQVVNVASYVVSVGGAASDDAVAAAAAASSSATAAAASYDSFDDRYLGAKTSDPSVDNDGNTLITGAIYWNSSSNVMKVWSGSAWVSYNPAISYLPLSGGTMTGAITFAAGQTVANLAAGSAGTIPYQSASGTTAMLAAGTSGYVLQANGAAAPTWVAPRAGGITMGTPVASTSGTAITFTGIPAGTKRITVMLVGVSTNGTSEKQIRIGDSGGLESTGYLSVGIKTTSTGTSTGGLSGTGFVIFSEAAADVLSGSVILSLENSSTNSWVAQGLLQSRVGSNAAYIVAGNKSLSSVLTQISVDTPAADNFDAGEINIFYE